MTTLLADPKYPNTGDWQGRHNDAVRRGRKFERPIVNMLAAWQQYAIEHQERYESPIGEDGYLAEWWEEMGDALRALLNGETGRLDCGTLDGFILKTMRDNGVSTENK